MRIITVFSLKHADLDLCPATLFFGVERDREGNVLSRLSIQCGLLIGHQGRHMATRGDYGETELVADHSFDLLWSQQ